MDGPNNLPLPPWWSSRETSHAARDGARKSSRHGRSGGRSGNDPGAPLREPVTPDRIADAALRVIDARGLDGLTVRALAQELGFGTMTLYWYVQNKDEVLDLVSDRLVAGVVIPPADTDWRVAVREVAIAVRAAVLRHANAVPVLVSRGSFGPNVMRLTDEAVRAFRSAGFGETDAADAYFAVSNFVYGSCASQTSSASPSARPDLDRKAYFGLVRQYIASLPANLYPNLQAAAPRMFTASPDERFAFGMDCLIAGLEARLAAANAAAHAEGSKA